ncbi:AEC family transporter [Marivivens donghaensis]|uniref:AEC family transporter n=1 Tax=Marivivens donghaensis TaxID=1699413 RepID=A0ABX0VZT5_9RHOB|nr:AEC family transporter [Marivivens donghaensis]NIY72148.1 AEC family transporter [Marivivens donghaensis]
MIALIDIILPVFLVLGFGYFAVWKGWFKETSVDELMKFAQNFAVPCLLFKGISSLDLGAHFDVRLLFSFYAGAISGFIVGITGARLLFKRSWEDSIAIGFIGLFSNSLLLGLPITERAYGSDALASNYAIIAIHSPVCYAIGITTMEIVKNRGGKLSALPAKVLRSMFRNALILGISAGLIVNLTGIPLHNTLQSAIDLMARAALPAALFALGGVLVRYKPQGDLRTIGFIVSVSLVLHPTVTWLLGTSLNLSTDGFRSAVVTAAMAPGINAYLFANMYGHAKRVAASAVLIGTGMTVLTAAFWLMILP